MVRGQIKKRPVSVEPIGRTVLTAVLSWIVPGLGHLYLKERGRGLVFLVTITVTFWTGIAIGGVRNTVDPKERVLWFAAQLCTGGHALSAYALHEATKDPESSPGPHLSSEVGVHYTGVAGLLNILVILDAIARAELAAVKRPLKVTVAAARGAPE
jgi:hypothetical protein